MNEDALIRRLNLRNLGYGPAELSRRCGRVPSYWGDLLRDDKKSFGEKIARQLEEKLGLPRAWLDTPHTEEETHEARMGSPQIGAVALPLLVTWETLGMTTPPREFRIAAPNDALAPRLREGQQATFDTEIPPKPGDGILVKDNMGAHHIRVMRQGVGSSWDAHAFNDAYRTLNSESDGLQVVAVLTGVMSRWS